MMTASVMSDRAESNEIVWTPGPAISNSIVSRPFWLFAAAIASRREMKPSEPLSAINAEILDVSPSATSLVVSTTTVVTGTVYVTLSWGRRLDEPSSDELATQPLVESLINTQPLFVAPSGHACNELSSPVIETAPVKLVFESVASADEAASTSLVETPPTVEFQVEDSAHDVSIRCKEILPPVPLLTFRSKLADVMTAPSGICPGPDPKMSSNRMRA